MTRSSPTTSPREFSTATSPRSPASRPSLARNAASALRSGRCAPSSALSAIAEPVARRAEQPFGPALRDPAVAQPHELRVGRAVAADELRTGTHRVGRPRAAVEPLEPGERVRHPLERERVGQDAAAVDRGRQRGGLDLGRRGDLREHRLLAGMRRRAGSPRSASRARGRGAASPRACPSSCARGAWAPGRTRGRPRSRRAFASRQRTGSS